MKQLLLSLLLLAGLSPASFANNLKIENVTYNQASDNLTFDISWENSWHINDEFHDAIWLFVKYKSSNSQNWKPVVFDAGDGNPATFAASNLSFQAKEIGVIIKNGIIGFDQKNVPVTTVTISNLSIEGINPSIKVFGTEMVYVPEGSFDLGDRVNSLNGFRAERSAFPLKVDANVAEVYTYPTTNDTAIPLASNYPTGFKAFYCMKYEITQGQMVDFLNTLTAEQLYYVRTKPIRNEYKYLYRRGEVRDRFAVAFIENNSTEGRDGFPSVFGLDLDNDDIFDEEDDGANIACPMGRTLFLSYLDWAGLRPMSEMEYEKACRGTEQAVVGEFAWGTGGYSSFAEGSLTNLGTAQEASTDGNHNMYNNLGPLRVGFAATSNSDRITSGNSFYGIANLSDNLSERTVQVTDINFSYEEHGDGLPDLRGELATDFRWLVIPYIFRGANNSVANGTKYGTVSDRTVDIISFEETGGRGVLSFE